MSMTLKTVPCGALKLFCMVFVGGNKCSEMHGSLDVESECLGYLVTVLWSERVTETILFYSMGIKSTCLLTKITVEDLLRSCPLKGIFIPQTSS